ncbi:hypothetical protein DRB96_07565 [Streptomyces sp. ICC1]|nr:hypothetical protein DRB89_04740 [Streptomyces sp. ICC4]AWZ12196.1 hypothetical protein DRB96_07565 [Streptomyces sp. ICC1]
MGAGVVAMSEEIEGAAEEFERAVSRLRGELRSVAARVSPGVEPRAEERTADRHTAGGAMGKRFSMSLFLAETSYESAVGAAADAFAAAGWRTESRRSFHGHPFLRATREGFEAGVGAAGRTLRISGQTPVVWIHAQWVRPPRAATPETLKPGYRLCAVCEGWGSCRACEGLGFVNSRRCAECGLGMDCPDCRGTGQERVRRVAGGR